MPTLTRTEFQIALLNAPLGAIVTGLDASKPVRSEVVLQLKQALRERVYSQQQEKS